jgi:hypothetical protein
MHELRDTPDFDPARQDRVRRPAAPRRAGTVSPALALAGLARRRVLEANGQIYAVPS